MEIVGYPTKWNELEGLQPIDLQDIQIQATERELKILADFFRRCAEELENQGMSSPRSIELQDSKPGTETGISILVSPCT
jgi:hypothetical protein